LAAPRRVETKGKRGYLLVKVCVAGRQHCALAHRLVWTALKGAIPVGFEVNHRDGNKHHNHPNNLELVTSSENHRHAYQTGLRDRSDRAGEVAARARELRSQGLSFAEIARELDVSQTTAFRAVRRGA
jgi:hypothetical protein